MICVALRNLGQPGLGPAGVGRCGIVPIVERAASRIAVEARAEPSFPANKEINREFRDTGNSQGAAPHRDPCAEPAVGPAHVACYFTVSNSVTTSLVNNPASSSLDQRCCAAAGLLFAKAFVGDPKVHHGPNRDVIFQ